MDQKTLEHVLTLSQGEKYEYDRSQTWVDLFRAAAALFPDRLAVHAENGEYTYRELDRVSDRLAAALLAGDVREKDFVAVRMGRVREFVAVVLAIHKIGAAYMPIDEDYPADRVDFMMEDSGARITVTEAEAARMLSAYPEVPAAAPVCRPDSPAYMIYTSGTTGKPKGVVIAHRGLTNLVHFIAVRWGLTADSRIAVHSNFAFDAAVEDLFPVLTVGGAEYIVPENARRDLSAMRAFLVQNRITGGCYSTQFGQLLGKSNPLDLDYICLGGEAMTSVPETRGHVYNTYGPTEFTVDATYFELEKGREYPSIPIGRPLFNCAAYVVNDRMELLPPGETGELCMAGPQLAMGYWKRPELTAERFIELKLTETESVRAYRTGDLVRWNQEGQLIFCGRVDFQVKLRGFRIELGEIEHVAQSCPGVRTCAAEVKKIGSAQVLCLYYTEKEPGAVDEAALEKLCDGKLPDYMVPGVLVRLEEMPMTINGKVDRRRLPIPELTGRSGWQAPSSPTQQKLCAAFEAALGLEKGTVGIGDDFFAIGGDSIRAMNVMTDAGLEGLSVRMIFRFRTPAAIAEELEALKGEDMEGYEKEARTMRLPITPAQQLMFYDMELFPESDTMYNLSGFFRIGASLDAEKLARAVDQAAAGHPGLCSVFEKDPDGKIWMRIHPGYPGPTVIQDVAPEDLDTVAESLCQPFTLFGGPVFRARVLRCGKDLYLFVDMLHMVSDGSSLSVLYRDIARAYRGEELSRDYFYSYVRREAEIQGTPVFDQAKQYFVDLLDDRNWCRLPTPDNDTMDSLCSHMIAENVLSLEQMDQAEKRTGYSRNVIAMTATMLALRDYCGESRVSVDYVNNNRMEKYLQNTVGLVYKTLPLAVDLSRFSSQAELLQEVNRQSIESFIHSVADYTAKEDLEAEDAITINYVSNLGTESDLEGFEAREILLDDGEEEEMGGHMDIYLEEGNGQISLKLDYLKNTYHEGSIRKFLDIFIRYLRQLVSE